MVAALIRLCLWQQNSRLHAFLENAGLLSDKNSTGHDDAADADVWTQTLADTCCSPEYRGKTVLVLVHDGREDAMCVGACADEEEDDQ